MQRSTLKRFLVLALVLAIAGLAGPGALSDARASDHEGLGDFHAVSRHYFPMVPNDAMIADTGPWHSAITVQSMESTQVRVFIMPDGRFDPDRALVSFTLESDYGSRTVTAEELGIEPGAATSLVVMAIDPRVWEARDNPDGLAAAQSLGHMKPKVTASVKMAAETAMDQDVWTDDSHDIVDGYSAIPMNDVGWGELSVDCPSGDLNGCADVGGLESLDGTSYLPLVQTNNDWNTTLYITNVEGATDQESAVEVELTPSDRTGDGDGWSGARWLMPGETWEIDLLEEVGPEWTGSVRMESNAGMAAVAARHKAGTDMMLMNTSAPSRTDDGDGYRLSAPLVYVDYFGWNTGISLSNQSDEQNTISVNLYDENGILLDEAVQILSANGQANIYLPGEVDPEEDGWLGSAVLVSEDDAPFHAAVDQVNYVDGAAMSYTLGAVGAVSVERTPGNQELGLPLVQKSRSVLDNGDTSGIQLFNPDPENDVQAEIRLLNSQMSGALEIELEPLESYNFYVPDESEIPMGTVAAAIVTVTGGDGEVIAVSNMANYDVQGDGALVFNLSNGSGQFR